jgi:hypothetical protein
LQTQIQNFVIYGFFIFWTFATLAKATPTVVTLFLQELDKWGKQHYSHSFPPTRLIEATVVFF